MQTRKRNDNICRGNNNNLEISTIRSLWIELSNKKVNQLTGSVPWVLKLRKLEEELAKVQNQKD